MGTKGQGRRTKTRFHTGAKRGHFTGQTSGKRLTRGDAQERGDRKARQRKIRSENRRANRNALRKSLDSLSKKD